MTTKDYIYLGLILLTALAFYCNGFYAGVYRCKRMYDSLLDDQEVAPEDNESAPQNGKLFASKDKVLDYRGQGDVLPKQELRGDFGRN